MVPGGSFLRKQCAPDATGWQGCRRAVSRCETAW